MVKKEPQEFRVATVKLNGGMGALLCSNCRTIIAYGFSHEDRAHYCEKPLCQKVKTNETRYRLSLD